jgi:hypothetical protein
MSGRYRQAPYKSSSFDKTGTFIVADQPDQQPGTTFSFQQALTQAIALWDTTPVSILDQQAAQTHALLMAMGKYITYRKEKGELESCADGSDFIKRLIKDL